MVALTAEKEEEGFPGPGTVAHPSLLLKWYIYLLIKAANYLASVFLLTLSTISNFQTHTVMLVKPCWWSVWMGHGASSNLASWSSSQLGSNSGRTLAMLWRTYVSIGDDIKTLFNMVNVIVLVSSCKQVSLNSDTQRFTCDSCFNWMAQTWVECVFSRVIYVFALWKGSIDIIL